MHWAIPREFIKVMRLFQGLTELMPCPRALVQTRSFIANTAFDVDEQVIEPLRTIWKVIVIPPKFNRAISREYDKDLYKARHLLENFFARLKQFLAIATRYDKCTANFLGEIYLAASMAWLN